MGDVITRTGDGTDIATGAATTVGPIMLITLRSTSVLVGGAFTAGRGFMAGGASIAGDVFVHRGFADRAFAPPAFAVADLEAPDVVASEAPGAVASGAAAGGAARTFPGNCFSEMLGEREVDAMRIVFVESDAAVVDRIRL